MTDPWTTAPPAGTGDFFKSADHEGELLLITVHGVKEDVNTSAGTSDAISADIVALDGTHKGEDYPDSLLFGKVLIPQLRRSTGGKVLGRLQKGVAQPGKTAPWQLNGEVTEADTAAARAYLAGQFATAAAPF